MKRESHSGIHDALQSLSDASCRLAEALGGKEPTAHLKESFRHAILAAASTVDNLTERVNQSCASACTTKTHETQPPTDTPAEQTPDHKA